MGRGQSKSERGFTAHRCKAGQAGGGRHHLLPPPPPTCLPLQTAAMQDELGDACATVMVSWEEGEQGGSVHFEAFQCSEQCVRYMGRRGRGEGEAVGVEGRGVG